MSQTHKNIEKIPCIQRGNMIYYVDGFSIKVEDFYNINNNSMNDRFIKFDSKEQSKQNNDNNHILTMPINMNQNT